MSVAIGKDDSWLGVKSQSNSEIAGFLRNPFRWGVKSLLMTLGDADHCSSKMNTDQHHKEYISNLRMVKGVEHSMGKGGPKPYQFQGNSEYFCQSFTDRLWVQRSKAERERAQIVR